jgi:hypothetical protein
LVLFAIPAIANEVEEDQNRFRINGLVAVGAGGTVASSESETQPKGGQTYASLGAVFNGKYAVGVKTTQNLANEITDIAGWFALTVTEYEYLRLEVGRNDNDKWTLTPTLGTEFERFKIWGGFSIITEVSLTFSESIINNDTITTSGGVVGGLMRKF